MAATSSRRNTSSEPNWRTTRVVLLFTHKTNVPKPGTNLNPFSRRVSRTYMVTLAHTYISTRTPHMCTRTDYHSVYTHPCKLRAHIRKYTHQHMQLCVSIHIYGHKHMQTLCVNTLPHTHPCKLCVHIRKYIHTKNVNAAYIYVYRHTHMETLCVCT